MNYCLKSIVGFIFFLLTISPVSAQFRHYDNPFEKYELAKANGGQASWQRSYIGFGMLIINNKITIEDSWRDALGYVQSTTITKRLRSSKSFTYYGGTYWPVAGLGRASILAISAEGRAAIGALEYDAVTLNNGAHYTDPIPVVHLSLPVSIDYKFGGDAVLSKEYRSMFAFGVGMAPGFYSTFSDENDRQFNVKLAPFAKLELGMFMGIAFKLQALAFLSDGDYFEERTDIGANDYSPISEKDDVHFKTSGSLGASVSLMIMPFSWDWERD